MCRPLGDQTMSVRLPSGSEVRFSCLATIGRHHMNLWRGLVARGDEGDRAPSADHRPWPSRSVCEWLRLTAPCGCHPWACFIGVLCPDSLV